MSLHSDLMMAGSELLAEVLGTPAGARYWPPVGESSLVDLVSTGQITVEEELVAVGRGLEQTRRIEKLTLSLHNPPELALTGRIQVLNDEAEELTDEIPDTWEIVSLRGLGTAAVTVDLKRPLKMATGRAGRHQKTS